eukprot:Skav235536  [mRNA]  locus=scaffold3067:109719:121773:+ [translate_table: standard]
MVGMGIRHFSSKAALFMEKAASILGTIFLLTALVAGVVSNSHLFTDHWKLWVASALLMPLGSALGYASAAWIARLPAKACRTICLETGLQNSTLALTILAFSFGNTDSFRAVSVFPLLYSLFLLIDGVLITILFRFLSRNEAKEGAGKAEEPSEQKPRSRMSSEAKTESKEDVFASVVKETDAEEHNLEKHASAVNRFRLISVVDTIVRQHWERMNREKFLEPLKKFAKKLKAYCDPTSGDSKRDSLLEAPQGIKDQRGQAQGKDGKGKADAMTRSTHLTCRDRLISAMLIEPEVLHMVFCFQQQFTTLFNCYAPNGHMQFAELWQFCVDFRLTPRFITEQQLRRAYEAAECFTVLPPRSIAREPARGVSKMGGKRNRGQRSKPGASPAPSASFQGAKNLQPELKQENERERHNSSDSTRSSLVSEQTDLYECETAFGASAFTETLCRVAFLYLGFYGSTLQQSTTSYFKISWLLSYLRRMSCLLLDNLPDVPPAAPSGAAVLLVEQLPKLWDEVSPLPAGCPVTLQQPMPGPGNRKMTCRRRSKHETMAPLLRPSKQTRDAALSLKKQRTLRNIREAAKNLGKAAMVVKKMTDNQMLSAVIPRKLDDSSSEDEVQPEPGAGKLTLSTTAAKERIAALTTRMAASFQNPKPKKQKKTDPNLLPLEELFKTEGGQPAIVNGTCQLCGRNIEDGGNPACRGCSIVDSINLQAHPFARLLYPESTPHGAKILRPKIKPHVGERLRPSLWLPEISQLRNAETGQ